MEIDKLQILITGGGKGIGYHLVQTLSQQVKNIIVLEINPELCDSLKSSFDNVFTYQCDVANCQSVAETIKQVYQDGFEIDVLINNAGLIYSCPLINILNRENPVHSAENWQKILDINLSSVFYVSGQVINQMIAKRKKGIVINISSIAANGNAGQSAYSASKAGVNALTKTWAKELGIFGLRFVAIAPGFLDTPSTREALSEGMLKKLKEEIPLRKLGEAQNVYQAVKFIIENDYINGTILEIDGGLKM